MQIYIKMQININIMYLHVKKIIFKLIKKKKF